MERTDPRLPDRRRRARGPDRGDLSRPLPPRHPRRRRRQEPRLLDPVHPQRRRLSRRHRRDRAARSGCATRPANMARRSRTSSSPSSSATRRRGLFTATWGSGCATARTRPPRDRVTNRRPPMDEQLHDDALARGLIRYCPICDGYEVTDKKVGVIGSDSHGVAEALFLRSFTADVTLIAPDKAMRLKPEDQQQARRQRASMRRRADPGGGDRRATISSSTPPRAITPSTASIRRSAPTPTPSSPKWSAPTLQRDAASWSTATSAPASPDFMPRATS